MFQLPNLQGDLVATATQNVWVFDGATVVSDKYGNAKTTQTGR